MSINVKCIEIRFNPIESYPLFTNANMVTSTKFKQIIEFSEVDEVT